MPSQVFALQPLELINIFPNMAKRTLQIKVMHLKREGGLDYSDGPNLITPVFESGETFLPALRERRDERRGPGGLLTCRTVIHLWVFFYFLSY